MSKMLIIPLLVGLVSCASNRFERNIAPENDALITETTLRFDGKRLNEWAQDKGLLGEATKLCQTGETADGHQLLKDNLNSYRNNPAYWLVIGNCYWYEKNSSKAEYFYRLALGLSKRDQNLTNAINNNIGILYMGRSLYPEAKAEFQKAEATSLTAKYNLAQIALLMGDAREAKVKLGDIYRVHRKDPDVLASLAVAHLIDGNSKVALQVLSEIPQGEDQRQDVVFYRAMGLYLKGDIENAEKEIERAGDFDNSVSRLNDMAKSLENLVKEEVERRLKAQEAAQQSVKG